MVAYKEVFISCYGRADAVGRRLKTPLLELQGCLKAQPVRRSRDPGTWVGDIFLDAPEDIDLSTIFSPECRLTERGSPLFPNTNEHFSFAGRCYESLYSTIQRSLRHFHPTFLPLGADLPHSLVILSAFPSSGLTLPHWHCP